MKENLTEIAFILDRSGSMESLGAAPIESFNSYLRDQQIAPGITRLTVVLFDDEYLVHANALPISEVLPLDRETYVPRNSTALLDAIGRTIEEIGRRLAGIPEGDRPGKVIVAILTDGLENASRRFTWRSVSDAIRHQTDKYQWEFLFLGANQDAIATAAQLSICAANSATFASDGIGFRASNMALSRKTSALRAQNIRSRSMTVEEAAAAEAPMEQLVREEDQKRRGS